MSVELRSYLAGIWRAGDGDRERLVDPVKGTDLAYASSAGWISKPGWDTRGWSGTPICSA
jgi:hypothetical protein